jgi:hypothetical protein
MTLTAMQLRNLVSLSPFDDIGRERAEPIKPTYDTVKR